MTSIKQVEQMLEQRDLRGLARALRDHNPLIRRRAAQALGELKQPEAVTALARVLQKDADQYVIRWAVDSLRAIGDPSSIDVLTWAAFEDRRGMAALAAQALAAMDAPEAVVAARVREMLARSELGGLDTLGAEAKRTLEIIIRSKHFETWASGKRKHTLIAAVRLGVKPPSRFRRDLVEMGLFVSGVHTLGDLLLALNHRSPLVRMAAAERLGTTNQRWTTFALNSRFRREIAPSGDRKAAAAMARAMAHLGDQRGLDHYKRALYGSDVHTAADAARALAEIGTDEAIQTLFWFAASPPAPPAYHNVPQVLSALEGIREAALPPLAVLIDHEDRRARLMVIPIIGKSGHPDTLSVLERAAHDADPDVQRTAVEAIGEVNTTDAVDTLRGLISVIPAEWLARALAAITHPTALETLRVIQPEMTALYGVVLDDDGQPLPGAHVQMVREHFFGQSAGWGWMPISARAETDPAGEFALAVMAQGDGAAPRLKVTTPARADQREGDSFLAEYRLIKGADNGVRVRVDRFFKRLVIDLRRVPMR